MKKKQIVLLATARSGPLAPFIQALQADAAAELVVVDSAEAVIETAVGLVPVMVIVDQELPGVDPLAIVQRLLSINAFIHTAVLTDMDEALFHERSEGLGILAGLPLIPGAADAVALLAKLREMAPV